MKHVRLYEEFITESNAIPTEKLVRMYKGDKSPYEVASFVYDNYDKITGYPLEDRDEEMEFPSSVLAFVDAIMGKDWHRTGNNYDDFSQAYGDAAY